jgi:hypothetical protein
MILFDKSKLIRFSGGSTVAMIDILRYITYRPIPKSKGDVKCLKYQTINWFGDSFLLNPEAFLDKQWKYTRKEVAQYILLAAKRSYPDYALFRTKTLPIHLVNVKAIENNRLLKIKNEEIYFSFEEAKNGN